MLPTAVFIRRGNQSRGAVLFRSGPLTNDFLYLRQLRQPGEEFTVVFVNATITQTKFLIFILRAVLQTLRDRQPRIFRCD
jgi:hypothetical protein